MIFSNLRHNNGWSRDNFSNQITDASQIKYLQPERIVYLYQ
jgi:hypothetical protein